MANVIQPGSQLAEPRSRIAELSLAQLVERLQGSEAGIQRLLGLRIEGLRRFPKRAVENLGRQLPFFQRLFRPAFFSLDFARFSAMPPRVSLCWKNLWPSLHGAPPWSGKSSREPIQSRGMARSSRSPSSI